MNSYLEMQKRRLAELSGFTIKQAATQEEFDKGMRELGFDPNDTHKIVRFHGGVFMRKVDYLVYAAICMRHDEEHEKALAADQDGTGYAYEMFLHNLAQNARNFSETRHVCAGFTALIHRQPHLAKALENAAREHLKNLEM